MAAGQKFGGRTKGTPNKATADVKALARKHGPAVIAELARIAKHSDNERTRVAAAQELLDRGYGRPHQSIEVDKHITHHATEMTEAELERIAAGDPPTPGVCPSPEFH